MLAGVEGGHLTDNGLPIVVAVVTAGVVVLLLLGKFMLLVPEIFIRPTPGDRLGAEGK